MPVELNRIVLPKASYKFRVMEVKREPSQKGNPMITVDLEIIDAPNITINNDQGIPETVSPNGMRVRTWVTLVPQSVDSSNRFLASLQPAVPKLTVDNLQTYDANILKSKVGYGIASGKLKDNTDSNGQQIINPHTGKAASIIDTKFTEFFAAPAQ